MQTLLLLLLLQGTPAAPPAGEPVTTGATAQDATKVDALFAEYDAADEAWRAAIAACEGAAEKKALKNAHPAIDFLPRFEERFAAGEGRAAVWIIEHAGDAGLKKKAADTRKRELFDALLEAHVGEPWLDEVARAVYDERRVLGDEACDDAFERMLEGSPHARVRAHAMQQWSRVLGRSRDDARKARGGEVEARLLAEFSDEVLADVLTGSKFRDRFLQVGQTAPDMVASDVDGETIRLSDYRGKVVLIDFWGFW